MSKRRKRLVLVFNVFFWIGVALAVACVCLIGTGHTSYGSRLEHQTVPLSWILGGLAIVAFVVAEQLFLATPQARETARELMKPTQPETPAEAVTPRDAETLAEVFPRGV